MGQTVILDARELGPHELLDRVLVAVREFVRGDRLRVLVEYEPVTLYRILERNNFGHVVEQGEDSVYVVTLWQKE